MGEMGIPVLTHSSYCQYVAQPSCPFMLSCRFICSPV